MICIKLDILTDQVNRIKQYQQQYSTYLHLAYNRLLDGISLKNCFKMTNYNNIELLNFQSRECATYLAKNIIELNKNKKVIFGGKKNYINRLKNKISKLQYELNRLNSFYSIGESKIYGCNKKFYIQDINTIIFKPSRYLHILLKIKVSKKYQLYLKILILHQLNRDIPITYKLSYKHIWIMFDLSILKLKYKQYKPIKNRIISIDMNPNYIGWSIIDWKNSLLFKLIDKGVLSIKNINDYDNNLKLTNTSKEKKYITNKRNFEVLQCSKFLINKMVHYKCSLFVIENLSIKNKDHLKGRKFNRLVNNNWCRTKLVNNLQKWCSIYNVLLIKVKANYSSFIGNIVYRYLKLPDMILSSILISRRCYLFYHQYIKEDKQQLKNIIQPIISNNVRSNIIQSLEELDMKNIIWKDLIELYYIIKKSKCKYRFPLEIKSFSHLKLRYLNYNLL